VGYCLESALHLTLFFHYFFQVHGMLSQMDPALAAYCDKIASQGGPVHLPDELGGTTFPATPVVQLGTTTRMSARLRHVQPEVNMDQGYEVLKRTKKIGDGVHAGIMPLEYKFVLNVKLLYLYCYQFVIHLHNCYCCSNTI
jgi:hypothetical protein